MIALRRARERLGATTVLLGHHYQRDEVVRFADFTGDSYKLSKIAAATDAQYIVFCGVHFMAESADVLARAGQQVILPDLNAGCSMADMAEISQVEDCWEALERLGLADETIPVTYINSTAAIKAFCGEHGGLVCTSSNARAALEWAFARGKRVLFLPDQHLGRNTGTLWVFRWTRWRFGTPGPFKGGQKRGTSASRRAASCCGKAIARCISAFCPAMWTRCGPIPRHPGHCAPRVPLEVCQKADALGSTEGIISLVEKAPRGLDVCHWHRDSPGQPTGQTLCR